MAASGWQVDDVWVTWWSHPTKASIDCDGYENGHWRAIQAKPEVVASDDSFGAFLRANDVEDDDDARMTMKHRVFTAGYIRCGLIQGTRGYLEGINLKEMRKAARETFERSSGALSYLDIIVVPPDLSSYKNDDEGQWVRLSDEKTIDRFIRRGQLPADATIRMSVTEDVKMTDDERDAERWRKLVALMRHSYDGDVVETEAMCLEARMASGRGEHRKVEVALSFTDKRDEPLDFAAAIDAVPWPAPPTDDDAPRCPGH